MGPARTDRRAGCWRPGFPGSGAGGRDASPAWPPCQRLPGSAPGVERMTRPRGGTVPGEESPRVLGNSLGRGPSAPAAGRGAHALPGCGGCSAPGEGVTASPARGKGAGLPAPPLHNAGIALGCVPSARDDGSRPRRWERGKFFWPRKSEKVGVGRGAAAGWSPLRPGWGPRPWVFSFPPAFPAFFLPCLLPPRLAHSFNLGLMCAGH